MPKTKQSQIPTLFLTHQCLKDRIIPAQSISIAATISHSNNNSSSRNNNKMEVESRNLNQ
jgi:hypothetical protein